MKRMLWMAPPAAALLACSGSTVSLQPGQWETTVQFSNIEMPGAPDQMANMMRGMMSRPQTHANCLTAEQAANPMGRLVNSGNGNNCTFQENTFSGGTIRVRGNCQNPGRGTMQISWTGNYTATTMQAQVSAEIHAPPGTPGPQEVRMSGTMNGHRTGDCAASGT